MSELEIQPPTPLKLRINLILSLFIRAQRIPNLRFLPVSENIIPLRKQEQGYTKQIDNDQVCVAAVVQRLVVGAVDEVCTDVTELHGHVVEGCGDGACADVVGVFRCPLRKREG